MMHGQKNIKLQVCVCECSLWYPACNVIAPCYIVICGLPRCTIFLYIVS